MQVYGTPQPRDPSAIRWPRVVSHFHAHEPLLCLAEGLWRLRVALEETVVLKPASTVVEAMADLSAVGGGILVIDDVSLQELPAASGRADAPLVVVATRNTGMEVFHERADIRKLILPAEGDLAGRLSLRIAELLLPKFPSDFMRVLPDDLSSEQRLVVAWAVLRGRLPAGASDIEERLAWRRRVLQRLEDEGVARAGEILSAAELWLTFRWVRERGCSLVSAVRATFPEPRNFEPTCVKLSGLGPGTLLEQGGEQALLACLLGRWRGRGSEFPRGSSHLTEAELREYVSFHRRFWSVAFDAARAVGASDADAADAAAQILLKALETGPGFWRSEPTPGFIAQWARWVVADARKRKDETAMSLSAPRILAEASQSVAEEDQRPMEGLSGQTKVRVRRLVQALPEIKRSVVRLCLMDDWSQRRAAALLDESPEKIKSMVRRFRAYARTELADLEDEVEP